MGTFVKTLRNGGKNVFPDFSVFLLLTTITGFQEGTAKVSSNGYTCFAQVSLRGPPML